MGGVPYKSGLCKLEKGDSLFLYTDGVAKAMNTVGEQSDGITMLVLGRLEGRG